ncbi:MAG: helix-turn-helix domain-containing protein [Firmicutes bacterium]|nr:helix-turn-helix domain-containing protein [Bacillota bacterium]
MEFDCSKVIERIKSACAAKGVSVNSAFIQSGVKKDMIVHLSNQHIPSADKFLKLAYFLGVTTDYLLGLSDN